jgi:acetoin utilization deacetylase AcuC-like enzyme
VDSTAPEARTPPVITTAGGVQMVLIPAGTFRMGSAGGQPDQQPIHEVRLDAFLIDRCEVTQEQYTKLDLVNGSHFKGPDRPVEMISWAEAAMYCNHRSRAEGLTPCYNEETTECNFEADGYRLPTEAEWEYACRAGTDGDYSFGVDAAALTEHAWCADSAGKKTHPVGRKKPNAWGLFDMHGNVAEWCNDAYAADYFATSPGQNPHGPKEGEKYVLRGGAWNSSPEGCRSAQRVGETPGFQDSCFARDAIGFRCVRRAPATEKPAAEQPIAGGAGRGTGWKPVLQARRTGFQPVRGIGDGFQIRPTLILATCSWADPEVQPESKTAFVYGDIYLQHETGAGHPERPERLTAIVARLKKAGLLDELVAIQPREAPEEWLTTIHRPQHVAAIRKAADEAAHAGSRDTPVSNDSYKVAVHAAGGGLAAVDAVMQGKVRNAFCAVRPPGHHATRERAMGFCLLNNVAVAARYVQMKYKLPRVLIVDWDVHHGNGTQAAFDDDPTVFYFSVHQSPFYPGTGKADDRGEGKAAGTKLNVPLPRGSGDREYRRAFEENLVPAAAQFKPDFVLISAGFDAHQDDLLGGMKVTAEGYAELTRIVKAIAEKHCHGRLVSVLEGGYGLDGLAASVEAHLRVLMQ